MDVYVRVNGKDKLSFYISGNVSSKMYYRVFALLMLCARCRRHILLFFKNTFYEIYRDRVHSVEKKYDISMKNKYLNFVLCRGVTKYKYINTIQV